MPEFAVAQIIPTGVGAAIGGYVGDATPATNVLASIADVIITHPNVVNGVTLNLAEDNALYVEGHSLDRFFRKEIALRKVYSNKIGIVLDYGAKDEESYELAYNTINSMKTIAGIEVVDIIKTKKPVGAKAVKNKSGAFVGELKNEKTFLDSCKKLIDKGAEAIAIATAIKINPKDLELYFKGKGPNPYGGTEAIISHAISRKFSIPTAHAPLLTLKEIKWEMFSGVIDPRAGAEAMSPAYLGCVLQGLHKAPQLIQIKNAEDDDLVLNDLDALVLPYSCMGGIPALASQKYEIPIIGVKENKTVMNATPKNLGFEGEVISANNYLEAAGIIASMKAGINYKMVRRPIKELKKIFE